MISQIVEQIMWEKPELISAIKQGAVERKKDDVQTGDPTWGKGFWEGESDFLHSKRRKKSMDTHVCH